MTMTDNDADNADRLNNTIESKKKAGRVLILDDEASILDILEQYLQGEDYDCVSTTSPQGALDQLEAEDFALLVTDLKMPEMNGIEVVKKAKSNDDDLAIIVVSALIEVTSAIDAMRAGADDYILKPFNLNEISMAVANALQKRKLIIDNRNYQRDLEFKVSEATEGLKRSNSELRETKEYLEKLLHSTIDAIFTTDADGVIEFANEGAIRMMGYTREELIGSSVSILYSGGIDEEAYVERFLREDPTLQNYETEFKHKNDLLIPVNISLSRVENTGGKRPSTLAICKDITEQKRLEQELKEMLTKDSLTGLYNQGYFYDRLEGEIERSRRQGHPLSLLLFDLDDFKKYNDCHGHLEGDRVLQTVGAVVKECTREHVDIGFRYGGDEFTVLLPEADEEQAYLIAERIRVTFEGKRFDQVTLSIGMMSYRQGASLRSFIQFADAMMYDAKRSGGNQVFVYKSPADTKESTS